MFAKCRVHLNMFRYFSGLSPNKMAQSAKLLTSTLEMPDLNLDGNTNYSNLGGFVWISSVPPVKFRYRILN
jgi:hypothetical protein